MSRNEQSVVLLTLSLLTSGCAAAESKPVRIDPPRGTFIQLLGFSPDSIQCVYAVQHDLPLGATDSQNAVVFCEPATGKEIRRLKGRIDNYPCAAMFSAAGAQLVVGYGGSPIRVWKRLDTSNEYYDLNSTRYLNQQLAFSPDGKLLVGRTNPDLDGDLHVWDVERGRDLRQLNVGAGPHSTIGPFAFSADGRTIAVEHLQAEEIRDPMDPHPKTPLFRDQLSVDLWDVNTGRRLGLVGEPSQWIQRTGLGSTGRLREVGAESGGFRVRILSGDHCLLLPTYNHKPPALTLSRGLKAEEESAPILEKDGRAIVGKRTVGKPVLVLSDSVTGKELRRFEEFKDGNIQSACLSPDCNVLAASAQLAIGKSETALLIWDVSDLNRSAADRASVLDADRLEALWADLADADASKAHRAMRVFAAAPDATVPFLGRRQRPVDASLVPQYIVGLNSDDLDAREKASRKLEQLGEAARPGLEKALEGDPPAETRRRAAELLDKLKGPIPPDDLRGIRAVDVLERIGTDEARKALKALAGGAPGALVTQAAKDALERLADKP